MSSSDLIQAQTSSSQERNWAIRFSLLLYFTFMLLTQYHALSSLQAFFFPVYVTWAISMVICHKECLLQKKTIKNNWFLYVVILLTVLYQLTFGMINFDEESVQYCVLRCLTLTIFILAVEKDYIFAERYFYLIWGTAVLIMSVIGGVMYPLKINGRYLLGWGNPNSTGAATALAFLIFLFSRLPWKLHWIGRVISLVCLLLSGSRGGILMICIGLLLWKKNIWKNSFIIFLCLTFCMLFMYTFNIYFSGWERVINTISLHESSNRNNEYLAALFMIQERLIEGWGLSSYRYVSSFAAEQITDLGSHNGYLTIFKMYGLLFGGVLVYCLFYFLCKGILKFFKITEPEFRLPFVICLSVACGAFFEDYLVGVHQFVTACFFLSCGLYSRRYR